MNLADTVVDVLGPDGAFAREVPGFRARTAQQDFAAAVSAAVAAREPLVAEAGTGTGKTFGYLAPILLSGRRAVIATATRALQDQLFERDLPLAARALGRPARVAVLKGRTNYLCRARYLRLENDLAGARGLPDPAALGAWVRATRTGDLAELPGVGEHGGAARLLSTTADACTGADCPEFSRCHVFAARRRAHEADIVIVNHHLLLADYAMKADGGNLLGDADVVVVDEAHALPEVARTSLGRMVAFSALADLAEDAAPYLAAADDRRTGAAVAAAARPSRGGLAAGRHGWNDAEAAFAPAAARAVDALEALAAVLERFSEASPLVMRAQGLASAFAPWLPGTEAGADFRWAEVSPGGAVSLRLSPLEPGETLGAWVADGDASWIFSSATLAVAGRFEPIRRELGLAEARTLLVESPFDYARQARLYLPQGMPDVADPGYTEAVLDAAVPLLDAAGGGGFLLFTSRQALRRAASLARERNLPYPLFVQDEAPRARLLEDFRAAGNGLLLGTASFWEGVDVKGEALVLVAIDRLPFASPGDPLTRARLDRCRENGGNPFGDIQLPEAVMAFKQGAGRLIRDASDRGVLMVCDPRVRSRSYGRVFLKSLPPMPVIRDAGEAARFLAASRGSRACA